jgi:hypothetical protein
MRIASLSTLALQLLFCWNSLAQNSAEPLSRTVFKLSPQHFTHNALKVGIERFNPTHSGSISLLVTATLDNNEEDPFDREGYNGLAGELQFRKYISPMKEHTSKKDNVYHQGIYGAAYVQGGSYSGDFADQYRIYDPTTGMYTGQTTYSYHDNIGNWGLGFSIGYQKTLWNVVFLEAFIGGGVQFADRITTGTIPDSNGYYYYGGITHPAYKGILPKLGLNVGLGL